MPVMNNDLVKKVVFYSTRYIHPYFSDKKHLIPSNSLINYFSRLQKNDNTKDEFSLWLSDLAFWSYFQQKLEDVCGDEDREKLNEIRSIVTQIKNGNPHDTELIEKCLESHDNEQDLFRENASKLFIELQEDDDNNAIYFAPCLFDEYRETLLSGETTHLNRDLTESKNVEGYPDEEDAKLKHRLGIYHREDNEYAVAAVWPWPKGDTLEPNHDENWKKAIADAIKELYPNSDEIILVIHDLDLKDWIGKDQIVFKRRPLSHINSNSDFNEDILASSADPCTSLIVFRHDNRHVTSPIMKKEHTPKDVWYAIDKYLRDVFKILREADTNKCIANAHNNQMV